MEYQELIKTILEDFEKIENSSTLEDFNVMDLSPVTSILIYLKPTHWAHLSWTQYIKEKFYGQIPPE